MLICRPPPSSDRCHPGQEQLGVSSQLLSPNVSQPHEVAVGQEAAGCGQAGGLQLGLENLGEEGRGQPPCGLVGLSNRLEAREGGEHHPPGAHTAVMLTGQRARVAWERIKGGSPGEVALGLVFREHLARRYSERHCGLCKRSSLAQLMEPESHSLQTHPSSRLFLAPSPGEKAERLRFSGSQHSGWKAGEVRSRLLTMSRARALFVLRVHPRQRLLPCRRAAASPVIVPGPAPGHDPLCPAWSSEALAKGPRACSPGGVCVCEREQD